MGPCPVFLSSVPVFLWCLCFNFRSNVLGLAKWPGDVWFSILFTWSLHARLFGILMASWILQMYGYLRCVMHIPWTIWSHALHTWKDKLTRLRQHKSMQYPTITSWITVAESTEKGSTSNSGVASFIAILHAALDSRVRSRWEKLVIDAW
jgi:hypothetical protein